jgi:hypothetical protein
LRVWIIVFWKFYLYFCFNSPNLDFSDFALPEERTI